MAVLMLVSLFSGMAFADDDVIVEEPVAEEVAEEPVVEEDSFEAADAFAEEYTEEGSFEAAGDWTPADIFQLVDHVTHEIDRVESKDGEILGTTLDKMPRAHGTEFFVFIKAYDDNTKTWGNPVKYEATVPHCWGPWVTVSEGEASCTTGGYVHDERTCQGYPKNYEDYLKNPSGYTGGYDGTCGEVEVTPSRYLPMQAHLWAQDYTYTGGADILDRGIIVAPTCQEDGLGNWVCLRCGAFAKGKIYVPVDPATPTDVKLVDATYPIYRMTEPDPTTGETERYTGAAGQKLDPKYHDYGSWTVIKPASCGFNGTKAHYCNLCKFQQTEDIPAYQHRLLPIGTWTDLTNPYSAMLFDHIERVDCEHYVEVWTCSLGNDCKGGLNGKAPFSVFVGFDATAKERVVIEGKGCDNKEKALDVKTAVKEGAIKEDNCFEYEVPYELAFKIDDYNTEHYAHHRYSTEWVLATPSDAPKCMVEGKLTRYCTAPTLANKLSEEEDMLCGFEDYKPTAALEPIYGNKMQTKQYVINGETATTTDLPDDGTHIFVHFLTCTRKECVKDHDAANYVPAFDFEDYTPVDGKELTFKDFTQDRVVDPEEGVPALSLGVLVDHNWGEWTVYVEPTATTLGHWTRTCKYEGCHQVEEFVGTQEEFDEMVNPPYPVLKTGIYHEGEGLWKLYEMGIFAEDFTGIYDGFCDGKAGLWYVVDGLWQFSENGATLVGDTWYFLAGGKVQEVTQLAEYEGEWFLVEDGVIDTTKSALVEYNGGKFVVAVGRIVSEYDGLWQNAKSIGGNDEWYYVADGKVQTDYTGLVQYDGEWFYVENGQLVPYNGQVEYDGGIFNVRDGMVVSQVA